MPEFNYIANFEYPENTPIEASFEVPENNTLEANLIVDVVAADKHYTHEQGIANDTWVIEHNLGKTPAIEVTDSANTIITGFKAQYNDLNTVTIYFNGAFTGYAYLN